MKQFSPDDYNDEQNACKSVVFCYNVVFLFIKAGVHYGLLWD